MTYLSDDFAMERLEYLELLFKRYYLYYPLGVEPVTAIHNCYKW